MNRFTFKTLGRVLLLTAVLVGTASAQKLIGTAKGRNETYTDDRRDSQQNDRFTDRRDGQKYRTVRIGRQTWMAENLNYRTGASWCYKDDNSNCEKYGRLYDWNTAKTACPSGWHLPSREEWNGLESASGDDVAGKMLKSTNGWYGNGNGIDANGFSALPGGYRDVDGSFSNVGKYGVWWTTSVDESGHADDRAMDYGVDYVSVFGFGEGRGLSVRCLQN